MRYLKAMVVAWLVGGLAGSTNPASADERLSIGSAAPPIDIQHWLNDKPPITDFQADKVYVIEFWATWCGPCVASIPHLRDLQQRHGEDVSIISVSDEDREKIAEFLEGERDGTTFAEMTSHYWLATDPDGSVKRDYMQAAEQHGIPAAFVVGKAGAIEWIGHPMKLDEPLAQVVAGTWDRAAFARQMEEEREFRPKMQLVFQQVQRKQFTEALATLETLLATASSQQVRNSLEIARTRIKREADAHEARIVRNAAEASGPGIDIRRLAIGDQVTIPVTGRVHGGIWGDAVYTLDSDVGAAAVHAGLVAVGETKRIKVWIVPAPSRFAGANRHGVQSRPWGPYHAAFFMQPGAPQEPHDPRP